LVPVSIQKGIERVIRSDAGVAHRLSLSARVVSAVVGQVKAKRQGGSASGACRIRLCGRLETLARGKLPGMCNSPHPDFTRVL
jgi:hypothetical protein